MDNIDVIKRIVAKIQNFLDEMKEAEKFLKLITTYHSYAINLWRLFISPTSKTKIN